MAAARNRLPLIVLTVICLHAWAYATEPPAKPASKKAKPEADQRSAKFLRIRRDADGNAEAMETAIATYKPTDKERKGLIVDLVGVVHVGDKSYYDALNKAFESYDAVLYELVAPEGTRIPKGGRKSGGGHPISALQQGMKNFLELEYQLDHVDYTKKNFVHADMSPEEFAKSMKDRNESFLKMFFRMLGQSAALQAGGNGPSDAAMLAALFAKDRALKLKRIIARQFEDMDLMVMGLGGPNGSTIITERNEKAFEVLEREIKNGKKRIAVFYGAGHLPDMDKRLIEEFKMKPTKTQWIDAWSLKSKQPKKSN